MTFKEAVKHGRKIAQKDNEAVLICRNDGNGYAEITPEGILFENMSSSDRKANDWYVD